ncbi:hypothetical protein [Mucilaginibacter frigoritolerans]|uniref:hypothetical protein n=1 Tax=Mucilaginibacter frigoritolerans TaxID=652788 RepID=UPI0011AA96DB|nr:hypothetical protein [Mucilaginibacter frigoritolerans]
MKQTTEHYRTYLMSIGVLAGVMLLGGSFLFFIIPEPPDTGLQTAMFVILMLTSGTIFTSTVFNDFGDRGKAIASITLPATAFEKFMVGWLYSYPIFMLVYTSVFYLVLIGLGSTKHWPADQHFAMLSLRQDGAIILLVIYSVLHSISIFGAIFFKKLQFIKTGFAFFVGYGLLTLLNTLFLKGITGLNVTKLAMPYGYLNFYVENKFYSIAAKGPASLSQIIILILVAILIWIAAYYRLKEKQV